jgi:hypothetical protein
MRLAKELIAEVADSPEDAPPALLSLARQAAMVLSALGDSPGLARNESDGGKPEPPAAVEDAA